MGIRRLRRLRTNSSIRNMVTETHLDKRSFILPYFIVKGRGIKKPIASLPGIYHFSPDMLIADVADAYAHGIRSVLLFGVSSEKDDHASPAYAPENIVVQAIKALRKEFSSCSCSDMDNIIIMTDICVCGYTKHGHCGILNSHGHVDNDKTLPILINIAQSHAHAGADFVAPSAMMDGQVYAIREALDCEGFADTGIMSYAVKYASSFYSPFRDAVNSTPQFGDRKGYQMDYRNTNEALREVQIDIDEGADIVMVKPALAYLDIIYRIKQKFHIPLAAYSVSGEYALLKSADKPLQQQLALEVITAIKRAGADIIITYFAKEIAKWL